MPKLPQAMSETVTSYTIGDPLCISDAGTERWCVVVGAESSGKPEVQMLEQGVDKMYRIGEQVFVIHDDMVTTHHALNGDDDKVPGAFDELGFRMIDGGTFVKHSDEVGNANFPVGEWAFDIRSSDEGDDGSDLGDFIVPDDECEPFTHAVADNDFVRDTHAAVRAFNGWVPKDEREAQARSFVLRQEARASHVDDEARFARNMAGANYRNPD